MLSLSFSLAQQRPNSCPRSSTALQREKGCPATLDSAPRPGLCADVGYVQGKGKQFTANTQILRRSSQRPRRGSGTEGTGLRSGTAVSDPITTRWERGAPPSRPAALGPHDSPQPPRASPRPGHPRRRHRLPPLGGGVTPRDAAAPGAGAAPAPLSVAFAGPGAEAARDCPLPPPRLGRRVSSRRG